MKSLTVCIIFLFSITPAWAFKCVETSNEQLYAKAERVFLIYVTQTELNEALYQELTKGTPREDGKSESIKVISVQYQIIEEFKGNTAHKPKLFTFLAIGMGYINFTPGVYYLIMIPTNEDVVTDARKVSICDVPFTHNHLQSEPFQEQIDTIRALKEK